MFRNITIKQRRSVVVVALLALLEANFPLDVAGDDVLWSGQGQDATPSSRPVGELLYPPPNGNYWGRAADSLSSGARVTGGGTLLPPGPFLICSATNHQTNPRVAWGDDAFLVVWGDERTDGWDIYGSMISPDGQVLDPDGFCISTTAPPNFFGDLALAWSGESFLAAWAYGSGFTGSNPARVQGKRISPEGQVMDSSPIDICTNPWRQQRVTVASDGNDFLVAWQDRRGGIGAAANGVYCTRVSASGLVDNTNGLLVASGFLGDLTGSWGDTNYLFCWSGFGKIYGTRVDPTGLSLDDGPISIVEYSSSFPDIAWVMDSWLVLWHSGLSLRANHVSSDGTASLSHFDIVTNDQVAVLTDPAFAMGEPNRYLTCYTLSLSPDRVFCRNFEITGDLP